jgi:hypothetical protein
MSYFNRLLPVMAGHEFCFRADEDRARELLRSGQCRLIRRGRRDRVLAATAGIREPLLVGKGTACHRVRYSHNRETGQNPPQVWTHMRQPSPAPFGRDPALPGMFFAER